MSYAVRTADRQWTEAYYESFAEMVAHWSNEIMAGTHYFIVYQT